MRITAAVPVIVTVYGLKEQLDRPCDTETRLYFEQQLDRGDAILTPLTREMLTAMSPVEPEEEEVASLYTHRLTSETGGVFHVRAEEAPTREWPAIGLPGNLRLLVEMTQELDRMTRQLQTLMAANRELEERVREVESERDHFYEMLTGRSPKN